MSVQAMFGHTVTIRPFVGEGARGAQYGDPVTEPCRINDGQLLGGGRPGQSRSATNTEVLAATVIYMRPGAVCPVRSLVTLPGGREATVIQAADLGGGTLPTPAHLKVTVQ